MQNDYTLSAIRHMMIVLNVAIVGFLSAIFFFTPQTAVLHAEAMQFSQQLRYVPERPGMQAFSLLGVAALLAVSALYHLPMQKQHRKIFRMYWLEPVICMIVIVSLHLDYNGLLFLVVVDLVDTLQHRKRAIFLSVMVLLYLLTSLDIVQSALRMPSVTDYMAYYSPYIQQVMQSALGLFNVFVMILFITYVLLLVIRRTDENTKIRLLNHRLEHANDKLSVLNEQLKAYASESERMAETRERNRLAREIHDTLGHSLTGIIAGTDACITMMELSPELAKKQLEVIASTARNGMNEVRRSVKALRPDALERFELEEALKNLCAEIQAASHATVDLCIQTENLRLSPDEEDAVYRTIQESLTNAIRHGKATQVSIRMSCEHRRLRIIVQDNGIGCEKVTPGFGLRHMRERLHLLNGTLQTDGTKGFRIEAVIPLRWGDEV